VPDQRKDKIQYLVVAYPQLSDEDATWIQSIRAQHDPNAALIALHFTLVFPTAVEDEQRLRRDIYQQVAGRAPFPFVIRCALPVQDLLSPSTHVFLVPDEGLSQLVRLHDALYAASLRASLRLDIPFIPHITVGAAREPAAAKALADTLNHEGRVIKGAIGSVSLVSFDGRAVELREQIALA
jgi:2'-5' RNA ligase